MGNKTKGKARRSHQKWQTRQRQVRDQENDDHLLGLETEALEIASEMLGFQCRENCISFWVANDSPERWWPKHVRFSSRGSNCQNYHFWSFNEVRRLAELLTFETGNPDEALETLLMEQDYLDERNRGLTFLNW